MNAPNRWDLSTLFSGLDDPRIDELLSQDLTRADALASSTRGRLAELPPAELRQALLEYEDLLEGIHRYYQLARLSFSADSRDPAARTALSRADQAWATLADKLAFFDLELKARPAGPTDQSPELAPWVHYLENQRALQPYALPEVAEQTTLRKDVTGRGAWVQLYEQIQGAMTFEVEVEGAPRRLTHGELLVLLQSQDRPLRARAMATHQQTWGRQEEVIVHTFNTLMEDHRLECKARAFPDILSPTTLGDDLPSEVVEAMLQAIADSNGLSQRYQALRARALGLPDYSIHDRVVPIFDEEPGMEWPEARDAVVGAFSAFSEQAGSFAREFLVDGGRVDVFPREGKASGAFCSPGMPPLRPFVLLNHAGRLDDAFTLAHELGHAFHFDLARAQRPLSYSPGRAIAETASVFGELWLQQHLLERWSDPVRRRILLGREVQSAMNTCWRQAALVRFELSAHRARAKGVLSAQELSALWLETSTEVFGPVLHLKPADGAGWMGISHFFFARFYCYSYAFGKLLTYALFDAWQDQGPAFVEAWHGFLRSGGSASPVDLVGSLGFDLRDPEFWQRGVRVVERQLSELESLVAADV